MPRVFGYKATERDAEVVCLRIYFLFLGGRVEKVFSL